MTRLLDSNILIYAGRPEHAFLDAWLRPATAQVSAISIPEVLGYPGLSAEDEAMFEAWFAELTVCAVTEKILRRAAALRRQRRMKLGDSIVAATALDIGAELVTRNVDDFRHIAELRIINPFDAA
ncbi:MAG TPA: type II toxin-antitoxin system VapC family toxin [Chthoniobacteraceae bacterium]|nr:type II toxin-antitoxin system VapC family toxin [Chthoniobacteraceae bacterium]